MTAPFKLSDWNSIVQAINALIAKSSSSTPSLPIITAPHRWSVADIVAARNALIAICTNGPTFNAATVKWTQAIVTELNTAIADCVCQNLLPYIADLGNPIFENLDGSVYAAWPVYIGAAVCPTNINGHGTLSVGAITLYYSPSGNQFYYIGATNWSCTVTAGRLTFVNNGNFDITNMRLYLDSISRSQALTGSGGTAIITLTSP